jgi:hypothetical protein
VSLKSFQFVSSGGGGAGTVTQINTAGPITGGPITSTGTINLAASGVTASTYGNATIIPVITVDTYGRITSAANVTLSAGTGTVTLVNTDANLTGGPISTSGTIGLANVISFVSGNVTTTNSNVGTAIVNVNTLNAAVNGLNAQIPVNYASTANLSVTYNNGTSGVGANLTATTNGVLSIDGASPAATQRVLIKDQTANVQNGVYTVTVVGTTGTPFILTRATDYNQSAEIAAGDGFYVISGSTQNNTTWVQQTPAPVTIGTTGIVFIQFAGTPSTSILPISRGGTGANTAVTALANLGGVSTGKAIAMAIVFGG